MPSHPLSLASDWLKTNREQIKGDEERRKGISKSMESTHKTDTDRNIHKDSGSFRSALVCVWAP